MSDLVAFLNARLDQDEARANAVYGFWRPHGERSIADDSYAAILIPEVDPETRAFILRYNPARVLREVEAKRRILAFSVVLDDDRDGYGLSGAYVRGTLAAVYSDHPDYDPAWALTSA